MRSLHTGLTVIEFASPIGGRALRRVEKEL